MIQSEEASLEHCQLLSFISLPPHPPQGYAACSLASSFQAPTSQKHPAWHVTCLEANGKTHRQSRAGVLKFLLRRKKHINGSSPSVNQSKTHMTKLNTDKTKKCKTSRGNEQTAAVADLRGTIGLQYTAQPSELGAEYSSHA